MTSKTLTIIGLIVLVVAVLVGLVATRVGGIAIRNDLSTEVESQLVISEPLVPGAGTTIRWQQVPAYAGHTVVVVFRGQTTEEVRGEEFMRQQQALVEVPCSLAGQATSVVLRDRDSGFVFGRRLVQVLPAGPECALQPQ